MWVASVRIFMYTELPLIRPLLFTWCLAYIRALAIGPLPLAITILSYGKNPFIQDSLQSNKKKQAIDTSNNLENCAEIYVG